MPLTCLLGRTNMENHITWLCQICIEHRHGLRLDTISYESKLYPMNNNFFFKIQILLELKKNSNVGIIKKNNLNMVECGRNQGIWASNR